MITQEYVDYLKSDTWQRLRSKRLAIDEYRCQRCGTPYGLQVHHLVYPEVLGTEDPYLHLVTLCASCHEQIEHQKKEYRKDKKDAIIEQRNYELRLIYRTIKEMACNDLSTVGIGKRDYCNIDVIMEDFGPILDDQLEMMHYVERVQCYFRNRRYRVILTLMDGGLTQWQIQQRTQFSWHMVSKVFNKPETARTILKNEKEKEFYAEADEL